MKRKTRTTALRDAAPYIRYIDLFCGIGGFRVAADSLGWQCVFSSDIDPDCQKAYAANFGDTPRGDIHEVQNEDIPEHDILLAGFPCQPFSIIGHRKGFDDTRGTLFFEIARIIKAKNPRAFVLENVKQLATHREQDTLNRILEVLRELGYRVEHKILNALDFGLPHKRERIFIVGVRGDSFPFEWPAGGVPRKTLAELLESDVPEEYYASQYIQRQRKQKHKSKITPAIWHENKGGNISSHPFSCTLRAGASYNYLLVDGIRRLTEREMLRLQGFPEDYKIVCNYSQTRKQAGNSVAVPVVRAVLSQLNEMFARQNQVLYSQSRARQYASQGRLIYDIKQAT